MKIETLPHLERNLRRVREIVGVLARYRLADWLKGLHYSWIQDRLQSLDGQQITDLKHEERVRLALTELGTTFIKLGQMMSTRADLVGPEMAAELAKLQSHTPADASAAVRASVEAELGRPPEELFARFDAEPFASASIAQVHGARLPSGEEVVVKIQHAGIEEKIQADLEIMGGLAELAEKHLTPLRPLQPVATVRQFRRTLLRELDFTYERQNLEEFARHFADDDDVRFPKPFRRFSSRRLLTMERFEGLSGTDPAALARSGADLNEFARRGATMYLDMIFRDSFYHADPHPGNLMLLNDGAVGVLDCGMVGRLDEGFREELESLLVAASERDSGQVTEIVLRLGSAPPDCPRDQLRADLDDFLADFVGQPLEDLNLGPALNRLTGIIRSYQIVLPPGMALLLRTLVELEGTSRQLDRTFSLAAVLQPYYFKLVRRRLAPQKLLLRLRRSLRDWEHLLDSLPRDLADVLARLRVGTFDIHLEHRRLEPAVNRLVMGLLTGALFLGSSLLWSTKAPPVVWGVSVFGAAGYVLALWWGWRLFRSIRKSGDIDSRGKKD